MVHKTNQFHIEWFAIVVVAEEHVVYPKIAVIENVETAAFEGAQSTFNPLIWSQQLQFPSVNFKTRPC